MLDVVKMNFMPIKDYITFKPLDEMSEKAGLIIVTKKEDESVHKGIVVAVGESVIEKELLTPGTIFLYNKIYGLTSYSDDLLLIKESDIMSIVEI